VIFARLGEEPERTCAKHSPETWFVDTRAGLQNVGGGSETPLSLDLTRQTKGRQGREAVAQRIEKKRTSRLLFVSVLRLKDVSLYRGVVVTRNLPWFDLLNSRNHPWIISACNRPEISHVTCVSLTPGWRSSLGVIFDYQINKRQKLNCRLEHVTTRSHIVTSHAINNAKRERARACGNIHIFFYLSHMNSREHFHI
jgi:hypothetical protein